MEYKVGDLLAFETHGHYLSPPWRVRRIVRVTPTGRMVLNDGLTLNPDLTIRGAYGRAVPITPGIRTAMKRYTNLSKIRKVDWTDLSDDQLNTLVRWIDHALSGEDNEA